MQTALLVALAVLATVFVAAGIAGYRRPATLTSFFLMDGKLNLGGLTSTLAATNFSLGNMVFLSLIWGYTFGFSGIFWLCIGFIIAAVVYVRFVRQPAVTSYLGDRENSGSLHEYLQINYSNGPVDRDALRVRFAASLATVSCLLIALTLELYLGATLLAPLIHADVTTVFVTLVIFKAIYSAMGGFFTVVLTDMIQGSMLLIAVLLLGYFAWHLNLPLADYSTVHPISLVGFLTAPKWSGILSIVGVTAGWYLVTMDTWQRASSARSPSTARQGMIVGTALLVVGIILLGLFGLYDNLAISHSEMGKSPTFSQGYNPLTDLYLFEPKLGTMQKALLGLLGVGFVAAALSTANTFLIVSGHSIISDLLVGERRRQSIAALTERDSRFYTGIARAVIILLSFAVIGLFFILKSVNLLANPLELFYLAYSIQFALLVPVIGTTWKRKPSARAAFVALISGIVVAVLWGFGFAIAGQLGLTGFVGLTISDLVYLAPFPPMIAGGVALLLFGGRA